MKEVKIISILTTFILLFTLFLSGCKTENITSDSSSIKSTVSETSSTDLSSDESTVPENDTEDSKISSTDSSSENSVVTQSDATSSPVVSSATTSSNTVQSSSQTQSSAISSVTSSKAESSSAASSSVAQSSSQAQSSATVTSSAASSTVASSAVSSPSATPSSQVQSTSSAVPSTPAPATPPYTVNDPQNTRGLDTATIGCYFGVASNDHPNQMSIDNQIRLDSYANVDALALDTVSKDKGMYLTFDCGYEYNNLTAKFLDVLKEKNVKAIFFCTLSYLKRNPQLVRRMINEGHKVGNHSATHPDFSKISRTKMAEELYLFDKYLTENFGVAKSRYFRFPSGNHSVNSLDLVTSQGYKSIFWSIAYKDWETANQPNPETAFETITSSYHPGAVILLHCVSKTNSEILGRLIDNAHQRGYRFKSLDEYYK